MYRCKCLKDCYLDTELGRCAVNKNDMLYYNISENGYYNITDNQDISKCFINSILDEKMFNILFIDYRNSKIGEILE